ncbi:MAG TPA: chemotaxis protein CheB [Pyrinomonadaceae bacterium]|nr:chemotaxis protein CheB [Pyrinomonadaceae bacterium]
MPKDIIVIGASAGGIEALRVLVGRLPADLAASIFVVLHTSPGSPGMLPEILNRVGTLPALNATDGERIRPGKIYVAPPDRHLVVEPGTMRVTRGPRENRFRPAIDPLFRSAAQTYGPRVVGVIMTGYLDDGTAGLWTIKQLGGTAVVQDPNDALVPFMPLNALNHVKVDYCLPLTEIAPLLVRLSQETVEEEGAFQVPKDVEIEVNIAKEQQALDAGVLTLGEPSNYACPECHGVLLQMKEGTLFRFRCHTGHAYSVESLMSDIGEKMDDAIWNAIRAYEEGELFMRHMAEHLGEGHNGHAAESFIKRADEAERRAKLMRQVASNGEKSKAAGTDTE